MKVRLLVSAAGDAFAGQPGDIVDMPRELAEAWADGIRGELVDARAEPVETMTAEARETAVRRPARRRK